MQLARIQYRSGVRTSVLQNLLSGTKAAEIQLLVDGMIRFPAISDPAAQGNDDTGANMVIEHLVKGQQVWIETYESENQNIYPGFTTFHGALITPA